MRDFCKIWLKMVFILEKREKQKKRTEANYRIL
jgi:hypothetical protein